MALTAADAYRRAIERFLGKLSGSQTVGQMEKKVSEQHRLALKRANFDVDLTFNEAAGVLAISTGQLDLLLQQYPPDQPVFEVKGVRKRTTTLTKLMAWAYQLKAKGHWKPLTERGTSPDTLLTAKLPFLLVKSPGAKQVIVEPLGDQEITPEFQRAMQGLGLAHGYKVTFMTFAEAFARPWLRPDVKRQWVDAFHDATLAQADRLRAMAHQFDSVRAQVKSQALEERLAVGAKKSPSVKAGRL
ncbi:hypothetical protein [Pseudoxanthomonas mexicana]